MATWWVTWHMIEFNQLGKTANWRRQLWPDSESYQQTDKLINEKMKKKFY